MSIYNETDELAKKFDAAYPDELSARLEWYRLTKNNHCLCKGFL